MHRWWKAPTVMVCLWAALACGVDADERMVRRYAECMADPNTVLHRLRVSNAVGAVPLSAEAVAARIRAQLERGRSPWRRSGPIHASTANRRREGLVKWRGARRRGRDTIRRRVSLRDERNGIRQPARARYCRRRRELTARNSPAPLAAPAIAGGVPAPGQ